MGPAPRAARCTSAGSGRSASPASSRRRTTSATRWPSPASTSRAAPIDARFGVDRDPRVNLAEIWLRDPRYLNEVLVQARATSFGLRDIRFATRAGVRVLLDQAAGIVIDLLVALSLIALVTAGVMLAASARAEVQRRLGAIGVRRAVGATRGQVVARPGDRGRCSSPRPRRRSGSLPGRWPRIGPSGPAADAAERAAAGRRAGAAADRRLAAQRRAPGRRGGLAGLRAPPGGRVVALLRGADVAGGRPAAARRGAAGRRAAPGGLTALGARLAAARRARLVATIVMLGLSSAFVLLMLSWPRR